MFSKENKDFLNKAILLANNMIYEFNKLIDIPNDSIDHIIEIPIELKILSSCAFMYFDTSNMIFANNEFVTECRNNNNNLYDLAKSIVHERIHVMRCILINDTNNIVDLGYDSSIYRKYFNAVEYDVYSNNSEEYFNKLKNIEEFITNGISLIIEYYYICKDYNKLVDYINNFKVNDKVSKLKYEEFKLVYSFGLDFIKQFLLSCYNDVYIDPLNNISKSNLDLMDNLYSNTYK